MNPENAGNNNDNLPSPGQFWQRPTPKNQGDPEADHTYMAVGKSLSAWETVELSFAQLFAIFTQSPSGGAACRAYGSITTGPGKVAALKSAAEIYYHYKRSQDQAVEQFDILILHYQQAAARRNEIAHGIVVCMSLNQHDVGHFLVPPDYNTQRTHPHVNFDDDWGGLMKWHYRFTSVDINDFSDKFWRLWGAVLRYHAMIT